MGFLWAHQGGDLVHPLVRQELDEVGGEALVDFLKQKKRYFKSDGGVVSDTGMPDLKHPSLTYALRGGARVVLHHCLARRLLQLQQ